MAASFPKGREHTTVMVSTLAFGIGIDFHSVKHVIFFGAPFSLEEYIQQAGRAGRDGTSSTVTLFYEDCALSYRLQPKAYRVTPGVSPERVVEDLKSEIAEKMDSLFLHLDQLKAASHGARLETLHSGQCRHRQTSGRWALVIMK